MNIKKTIGTLMMCAITATPMMAQQTSAESYQPCTYQEMEQLTVNEQVTTVITASEPIRFVDISTDKIAGDQPINNTVRLKPKEGMHEDGEVLAIVTIVTERYRAQYALLYTTRLQEAVTDKDVVNKDNLFLFHILSISKRVISQSRQHDSDILGTIPYHPSQRTLILYKDQ